MANLEKNMERNAADTKGKLEALKTAFDQMKDVLVKVEDKIEENPRKRRRTASGDKENIIVAGGFRTDSVELRCLTGVKEHGRHYNPCQTQSSVIEQLRLFTTTM